MTGNAKITRDMQTRELAERPKQWMPPEVLPEPDKQEGFDYRWVAAEVLGKADQRNLVAKMREGWEPVAIEEQPRLKLLSNPTGRFADNVEIGGLLLCKRPKEFGVQRTAHYAQKTQEQTEGVEHNLMRQSDGRMPIFREGKSSTTFGRGS